MVLARYITLSPCLDSELGCYRVLIHMKNVSNKLEYNVRFLRFQVLTAVLVELICEAVCWRAVTEIPKDIVPELSNSNIPRKILRVHNTGDCACKITKFNGINQLVNIFFSSQGYGGSRLVTWVKTSTYFLEVPV